MIPGIGFKIVTNSQLLSAYVLPGPSVNVQPISPSQTAADFNIGSAQPCGLASVTPVSTFTVPGTFPAPIPLPPKAPVTTLFLLDLGSNVYAVEPSLTETPKATIVITGQSTAQTNGIAVYQKAPPGVVRISPPVYIYVLSTVWTGSPPNAVGVTIYRYRMTSNPPYPPAGLAGSPTDATFIASGAIVSGVTVLQSNPNVDYTQQGMACSANGTLAVLCGTTIWLFDADPTDGPTLVGQIDLQIVANAIAFGPDGNLYVLPNGETFEDENTNYLYRYTSLGAPNGNPSFYLPGNVPIPLVGSLPTSVNGATAMSIGGTSQQPIVYIGTVDQYDNAVVMTFDGNNAGYLSTYNLLSDNSPLFNVTINAVAVVNVYSIEEVLEIPIAG